MYVLDLLLLMSQRIGVLVLVALLLTRIELFRRTILRSTSVEIRVQLYLALIFGAFGILGTYTGIPVQTSTGEAIANTRVVGVFIAGLLGGKFAGLGAGLIAGFHRLSIGGFTAFACALSTVIEGLIGGYIAKKYNRIQIGFWRAFFFGALAEVLQMIIIILLARPLEQAIELVSLIAVPMILVNGAGIAIFISIIQGVVGEQERIGAFQAQRALKIADKTLPYLRQGLNEKSAWATARIIKEVTDVGAVAITDTKNILAHIGLGDDHHHSGLPVQTALTKQVLTSGRIMLAESAEDIGCGYEQCPLVRAIIVPLKRRDETVGTLKLYYRANEKINSSDLELAQGIAQLFSTQLDLGYAEAKARLVSKAEIRALQAQINPHFLFNSLNVISSLIRVNPEVARELIINLANYFRSNLQSTNEELITLTKEIQHVKSYLAIEQARFGDRLEVSININDQHQHLKLPPLTLQPLVENAIRHGIKECRHSGLVEIYSEQDSEKIKIFVKDNGVGIEPARISELLTATVASKDGAGLALKNVHERLQIHFGQDYGLQIKSKVGEGTCVEVSIKGDSHEN